MGHAALVSQCEDKQDYEVTIHDTYAALEKNYPGDNWDDEIRGNFGQLMRLKAAQPEIKILPSIGGWTLSDPLFDLDNTANRKVFINSVIAFLKKYEFFDGVDIDWEFPGGGGANANLGSAKDSGTYEALMFELRTALTSLTVETGKYYEISSAIGTSPSMIAAVDYGQAAEFMDYIFMMTYDYKGSWSSELGHQTNLYASTVTPDDSLSIEISVDAMLDQGVESTKLVVGVAKYGRGWKQITHADESNPFNGLGGGAIDGTWEAGILDYKDIEANYLGGKNGQGINGWEYRWDDSAQAPILWNSSKKELISFDDERSVKAKGNFSIQHNLGGLFSWEIDGDTGTILNAMHEGLGHSKK
jgi:chitinase